MKHEELPEGISDKWPPADGYICLTVLIRFNFLNPLRNPEESNHRASLILETRGTAGGYSRKMASSHCLYTPNRLNSKPLRKPRARASRKTAMADETFLKVGAEIEVTSPDHSLRGALFPAKIVRDGSVDTKFMVEYTTLEAPDDDGKRLREEVESALLRPLPPRERNYAFSFGDNVDTFFAGGWWEGAITEIMDDSRRFVVYIRFAKQQFAFGKSSLRLHREWIKGNWVPPLEKKVSFAVCFLDYFMVFCVCDF